MYITSELDEQEREDMFRLKRVKQRKAKHDPKEKKEHICCCCRAMFESDDKILDAACPLCSKVAKTQKAPPERKLNIVPCKSEDNLQENRKRLEHLISHIDDVIDLTKQYKIEGIVSKSIEKFIKSCNQVKEKIEDYANAQPLCDLCRKALEATGKASASHMGSSKLMDLTCPHDKPTEEPPCVDSTYNLSPEPENKLGHFEKKFKEIVKVTRLQNEDGTISEEKQVITIKTERRNPRKPKTFDRTESSEIFGNFGGGGHGGDGKGSNYGAPRDTKSEHTYRSQQMSEPKMRSCMSACQHKPVSNRDATTNFSGGSCCSMKTSKVTIPLEDQAIGTHSDTVPKASTTTSCQMCCPNKSVSGGCGGEQANINLRGLPKKVSNAAVQACCKEVKINRPTEDRGTCCLPSCKGDEECRDKKETNYDKTTTTGTDAIWRDTCTSTTNLNVTPSKGYPDICCQSQDPNRDSQNEDAPPKESCCTIKILMKPPKVCTFEQKLAKKKQEEKAQNDQEVTIRGSMFETLKRIILPSYTPSSSKAELTQELEIKNICKNCISKFNSAVISQKSSASTAKQCQAKIEIPEKEMPTCPSCSMTGRSQSYYSESNKSAGVGSDTKVCHTCTNSPAPSMHSEKHVCCLAKKSSSISFLTTCCDLAAEASQKSVSCAKSNTGSASCFKTSEKPSMMNVCCIDAATNTKLSNRFDVRRAGGRQSSGRSKKDCSCRSEPYIPKNRCGNYKKARKCQSFDDAGYYYFRW